MSGDVTGGVNVRHPWSGTSSDGFSLEELVGARFFPPSLISQKPLGQDSGKCRERKSLDEKCTEMQIGLLSLLSVKRCILGNLGHLQNFGQQYF